jgi:hypothetical protein
MSSDFSSPRHPQGTDLRTKACALARVRPGRARILSDRKGWQNDRLDELAQMALSQASMTFRPEAAEIFASECSARQKAWAASRLCRHPLRPIISRFRWTEEKLGSIPKHYIECTLDTALAPTQQRALQTNMQFSSVRRLESDHSPFLLMPEKLAALIEELSAGGLGLHLERAYVAWLALPPTITWVAATVGGGARVAGTLGSGRQTRE